MQEKRVDEAKAQAKIEAALLASIVASRLDTFSSGLKVMMNRTGLSSASIAEMTGLSRSQVDQARKGRNPEALKAIVLSPAFKAIALASAYSLAEGKETYEESRRNPDGSFKRRDCKPVVAGYMKKTA